MIVCSLFPTGGVIGRRKREKREDDRMHRRRRPPGTPLSTFLHWCTLKTEVLFFQNGSIIIPLWIRKYTVNKQYWYISWFSGGKNNPLYIQSFTEADDALKLHHIVHCSLDVVDERGSVSPSIYFSDLARSTGYVVNMCWRKENKNEKRNKENVKRSNLCTPFQQKNLFRRNCIDLEYGWNGIIMFSF